MSLGFEEGGVGGGGDAGGKGEGGICDLSWSEDGEDKGED